MTKYRIRNSGYDTYFVDKKVGFFKWEVLSWRAGTINECKSYIDRLVAIEKARKKIIYYP